MNRFLNGKFGSVAVFAAAAMLVSCSTDELETSGNGAIITPAQTVASATFAFGNNTQITISNSETTRTAWMNRAGASCKVDARPANDACDLVMPDQPDVPAADDVAVVDLSKKPQNFQDWTLGLAGTEETNRQPTLVDLVLPAGETYTINGASIQKNIYVSGTLNIDNYNSNASTGTIYVLPGGTLNYNTTTAINGITIVNYGTFNHVGNDLIVNKGAALYTNEALEVDGTFHVGGTVFVDNTLTTGKIDPREGSVIRVMDDFTLTSNEESEFTNIAQVCVEGTFQAVKLNISCAMNLHADCKVYVTEQLSLHNSCTIATGYIKSPKTNISAAQIYLPAGGVADLGYLDIEDVSATKFYVVGDGNAMVSTTDCYLHEQYSLDDVIGAEYYFTYQNFYVDNGGWENVTMPGKTADDVHDVTIGTDYVNKATVNSPAADGCNPGFTPTTPDTPTPDTPTPDQPTPDQPTPDQPTPDQPTPDQPTPDTPTPDQPTPDQPTPDQPTPNPGGDIIIPVDPGVIEGDYIINQVDDFAIRQNGEYVESLVDVKTGTTVTLKDGIKITRDGKLVVTLSGLNSTNILEGNDYTYEIWMWINNEKEQLKEGTTDWYEYVELLDDAKKLAWVGGANDTDNDPYGKDISESHRGTVTSPAGYAVRYNIYRGIGGLNDTPYIKVSIHVQRDANAAANSAEPVYIPLVAKSLAD